MGGWYDSLRGRHGWGCAGPGSARREQRSLEQVTLDLSGNGGLARPAVCRSVLCKNGEGRIEQGVFTPPNPALAIIASFSKTCLGKNKRLLEKKKKKGGKGLKRSPDWVGFLES